jgi:hypothetical protein
MQTFIHELKQASPGGKVQPQMDTDKHRFLGIIAPPSRSLERAKDLILDRFQSNINSPSSVLSG